MSKSHIDQNSRMFDAHEVCERNRKIGLFPSPLDASLEAEQLKSGASGMISVYDGDGNVVEVVLASLEAV